MSEPMILEQSREIEVVNDTQPSIAAANDALLPSDQSADFRQRWQDIQTQFVDDPRGSVGKADQLVSDTITRLGEVFADQRNRLEKEWDKGENVSTEDLRQALRRYRNFFDRLLTVGR